MRRNRNAKIVVTLGPASGTPAMIGKLSDAGADVFRLNFSHGLQEEHAERVKAIRALEHDQGRPTVVLQDLQGPKFRIGEFADGSTELRKGAAFRLDLDEGPGSLHRVLLPHPEVFDAVAPRQHDPARRRPCSPAGGVPEFQACGLRRGDWRPSQ